MGSWDIDIGGSLDDDTVADRVLPALRTMRTSRRATYGGRGGVRCRTAPRRPAGVLTSQPVRATAGAACCGPRTPSTLRTPRTPRTLVVHAWEHVVAERPELADR
ncbi:hypothetical protein ABTX85_11045 [Streptomyces sp. NPDC096097]|uniref:hypothetical protein n=1 Tax=Streptomyces sp. NPDC096097 TaxID=3155546 RepID=UPI00332C4223